MLTKNIRFKNFYLKKKTTLIKKNFDFLNIDIEGLDFAVLKSINFKFYTPKLICVEVIEKNLVNSEIFLFLKDLKYKKVWSSESGLSHIFFIEKN